MAPVTVACAQFEPTVGDEPANRQRVREAIRAAGAAGAEIVVLPELSTSGYVFASEEEARHTAQAADGAALQAWAQEAGRAGAVVIGGFCELGDDGRLYNSAAVVDGSGVQAVYRKVHLFDATVDGTRYGESDHEDAGEELVVSRAADGTGLGLSVCYDLRFPELYRTLAVGGAQVLVVPSAFTVPTTRDHWEVLLRARAIEDQAFVVAANQVGEHAPGLRSGGRSCIVDPWGVVLAQAPDCETYVLAELDLDLQDDVRARLPSLAHRRPESYSWPVEVPR